MQEWSTPPFKRDHPPSSIAAKCYRMEYRTGALCSAATAMSMATPFVSHLSRHVHLGKGTTSPAAPATTSDARYSEKWDYAEGMERFAAQEQRR